MDSLKKSEKKNPTKMTLIKKEIWISKKQNKQKLQKSVSVHARLYSVQKPPPKKQQKQQKH